MAEKTIRPSQGPLDALAAALAEQLGFPPRREEARARNRGKRKAKSGVEQKAEPSASVATAAAAWTTALL
ncbi:hypothetical protein GY663_31710, partial [Klebsiella michiganensis]|nr:hypothetical protein [Klebsiella michiganensis]